MDYDELYDTLNDLDHVGDIADLLDHMCREPITRENKTHIILVIATLTRLLRDRGGDPSVILARHAPLGP